MCSSVFPCIHGLPRIPMHMDWYVSLCINGFVSILAYGFLCIPMDSCIPMPIDFEDSNDSHGSLWFLWIPMDSNGFPCIPTISDAFQGIPKYSWNLVNIALDSYWAPWIPMDSKGCSGFLIPMNSSCGFLGIPMDSYGRLRTPGTHDTGQDIAGTPSAEAGTQTGHNNSWWSPQRDGRSPI